MSGRGAADRWIISEKSRIQERGILRWKAR
jgi:hypothetical protein